MAHSSGRECLEDFADCGADCFDGSSSGLAQQVLELGEDLFDRVQVGRVLRQEKELGAGGADEAGTSAVVPAVINAIYASTGKRLRKLPIDPTVLKQPV